jgi:hypothetical protein
MAIEHRARVVGPRQQPRASACRTGFAVRHPPRARSFRALRGQLRWWSACEVGSSRRVKFTYAEAAAAASAAGRRLRAGAPGAVRPSPLHYFVVADTTPAYFLCARCAFCAYFLVVLGGQSNAMLLLSR